MVECPEKSAPCRRSNSQPLEAHDWATLVAELRLPGLTRELASHCEIANATSEAVYLRLSKGHRHLLTKTAEERLQTALNDAFGIARLLITIDEPVGETPAQTLSRARTRERDTAIAAIEGDPMVRKLIEVFDANLIESSIRANNS